MKIAFIVDSFPSLSETFILNQITGLIDRGHQVDIFARKRSRENRVHPDIKRYKLLDRTHYITVPRNKFIRIIIGASLIATNFHKNPKSILKSLNILKYGKSALLLQVLYAVTPFLGKNYDIIHCQFGRNGNLGALLKKLGIKGKLVTTFHGYDIRQGIEKGGAIYQSLFKEGDYFIAISPYNYTHLVNFGLDRRKIICHPVGIDLKRFPYKLRVESSADDKLIRVLTVARLVKEKGLQHGIKAVHKLLRQSPELSLRYDIIGEGPLEEELTRLIRELHLSKFVRLLGPRDQDQVIESLKEGHIFLLPSIAEVLPLTLMEAQAVGLPVIATNVGSVSQIVLNGKSGFLVPPGDEDALADRLRYLIGHRDEWSAMGEIGRRHVEENFDVNKLNDRLVELYQSLLSS